MTNRDEYPGGKPAGTGEGDFPPSERSDDANAESDELTVDGLQRVTEALRLRVEAARNEQVRDVKQKVADRETLIGEERKNDELMHAAEKSLAYYKSLDALGDLPENERAQLQKLRDIVTSLDAESARIRKRADALSALPAVNERLVDKATSEDATRAREKDTREAHEKLDPEIDAIMQEIQTIARRKRELWGQKTQKEGVVQSRWGAIVRVFDSAKSQLGSKFEFRDILDTLLHGNPAPESLQRALREQRHSLGRWGKRKEKAAIDQILRDENIFSQCTQAFAERDAITQQIDALQKNVDHIAERYRDVMLRAWKVQSRVNEETEQPYADDLPSSLAHRLQSHIERAADLKRWEDGRQVGKYKGWHEANQYPANKMLDNVWDNIQKKAGGISLVRYSPESVKETA